MRPRSESNVVRKRCTLSEVEKHSVAGVAHPGHTPPPPPVIGWAPAKLTGARRRRDGDQVTRSGPQQYTWSQRCRSGAGGGVAALELGQRHDLGSSCVRQMLAPFTAFGTERLDVARHEDVATLATMRVEEPQPLSLFRPRAYLLDEGGLLWRDLWGEMKQEC